MPRVICSSFGRVTSVLSGNQHPSSGVISVLSDYQHSSDGVISAQDDLRHPSCGVISVLSGYQHPSRVVISVLSGYQHPSNEEIRTQHPSSGVISVLSVSYHPSNGICAPSGRNNFPLQASGPPEIISLCRPPVHWRQWQMLLLSSRTLTK